MAQQTVTTDWKYANNVSRFQIGLSENKMSSNMAETVHLNLKNPSSTRPRDMKLVSILWLTRSRNSIMSSGLTVNDQKTRWLSICWKFDMSMAINRVL